MIKTENSEKIKETKSKAVRVTHPYSFIITCLLLFLYLIKSHLTRIEEVTFPNALILLQKAALALLDKEDDPDMKKRIRLVPLVTFGPFAFVPLLFIGAALDYFVFGGSGVCTLVFGALGFLFYVYSIILSVLTLKTEKKAQSRAYDILRDEYRVTEEELADLKELFHLYNIQYINDIILSSLELLYTAIEIAIAIKGDSRN